MAVVTTPTPDQITGVLLAGGGGARLGGRDKGLVLAGGQPLATWVLEALRPQVASCLISANRHAAAYAALGAPVVQDCYSGGLGPMAGMHAALSRALTPWILCVPCDAPLLSPQLGARLAQAVAGTDARVAVAQADGRLQAAHALLHRVCLPALAAALESGDVALHRWHARQEAISVPCDDIADSFSNINTPDDLERFTMQIASDHHAR